MPKIFVSYRHEDSSYLSGIIASRLATAFGQSEIVLDVDNIPPGQDFREHIKRELQKCDYLIAVIGKAWLTVRDEGGRPRLENPADWVRIELEAALGRESKIPVIPVLLDNLPPLKQEQLPESLQELAYRQALSIRPPSDFDQDVEKLIEKIKSQEKARNNPPKRVSKESRLKEGALSRRTLLLGSAAILAVVGILLTIVWFKKSNDAGLDPPLRAVNRPNESVASSEKSPTALSTTPQSVPSHENADRTVSSPPPTPRPELQFEGSFAGQMRDDNSLKTKLVWIPLGTFMMGSPQDEKDRESDESQVKVTLTQGFWLGQCEVTQSEWQRVMQTTPWSGQYGVQKGHDYPATCVNWDDVMKFCEKLTEQERHSGRLPSGWQYTLPTEAQWEYACRAGTTTRFSFGDDESKLGEYAWFKKSASDAGEEYAHQVGVKKANPWGLHDMHGNTIEWCRDWSQKKLAGGIDPEGLSAGSNRVERGGDFVSPAIHCRSAQRNWDKPSAQSGVLGFRVGLIPSGH
jgi:formylglycine-generating enzyme required for sulfatase activity